MRKKVEKFEDLVAWQRSRDLTKRVYELSRKGAFGQDYGLRNQIQRAAVSIMSNLAEGFERGKNTEFHQFVSVAKGSCAEVRCQLYIALDAGYLSHFEFRQLKSDAEELGRILGGLRRAIQKKRDQGH
ncbi:MAG: four helix bundle protein [Acidobacteria bacterium]|nr:MAG: four helix bundle protein [Acidobacteriota bacterium]REK02993.1 MAG: four helix bundle protein [Acidobacteriota bacterium]REK13203.1 MAG: four helix bundle protein [Acidobacteriota bacterium]REK41197.1 MAG: four helix bundle protein [Acidobacteriota bacterium]